MIRRHPILWTLLILIIGGVTFAIMRARRPKPTPVRVAPVHRVDRLVSTVTASGEIRAHDQVDIHTEIAGVITELPVKEGQVVKKGDVLLRVDPFQAQMTEASEKGRYEVAQAEVAQAKSVIAAAEADLQRMQELLKTAQADLAEARITAERDKKSFGRYDELLKTRAISRDEYEKFEAVSRISAQRVDRAQAAVDQAQAQITATRLAVEKARIQHLSAEHSLAVSEAALKQAKDQLTKTTIKSPMDGVIVQLNVDIGERAVPGNLSSPEATLMTLANLSHIEAEIKVSEVDITRIKLGQQVAVKVDALQSATQAEETKLPAHVTEVASAPINGLSSQASSSQEGRDFKVVATIDNPPPSLRMGMLCDAEVTIETIENVLAVPLQALTSREVPIDAQGRYVAPPKPDPKQMKHPGAAGMATASPMPRKEIATPDAATSATGRGAQPGKEMKKEMQGVYVKGPDNFAHFRPITVGLTGEMDVEVRGGLKEGEQVITGPLTSLRQLNEWTWVAVDEGMGPMGPMPPGKP